MKDKYKLIFENSPQELIVNGDERPQKLDIDCIRLYLEAIITKAEKLQKDILHKRTLAKEIYILAENALKKLKEI
jgi:hypothetical protein